MPVDYATLPMPEHRPDHITEREWYVLTARKGPPLRSLAEVASALRVTRERVRWIEERAAAKVLMLHDPLYLGTDASILTYALEGGTIGRALRPGMDIAAVTAVVREAFEGMYGPHDDVMLGDYRAIAVTLIERGIVPGGGGDE